jgi:hypothetical protein
MALTSRKVKIIEDAVNTAFKAIGVERPTNMPQGGDNENDPLLWEMCVANHLNTLASKRKERAFNDAIKARLFSDPKRNPQPPGTDKIVASGNLVQLHLKVVGRKSKVDYETVLDELQKAGVKRDLIAKLVREHTEPVASQHTFTAEMITDD